MSQIIAGLLVDEIRKAVLPLSNEAGRTTERHLIALSRLPGVCEPEHKRPFRPHCDGLAVIGAGALGTWFGLATGMLGIRLPVHIYDDDTVEETNLNRQVLFFDSVGKSKAIALASRLKALFPSIAINGYGMRVDEGTVEHVPGRALLAACPDNFAVRAFLNGVAGSRRAILISGGTSAMGGSSATYVPGHQLPIVPYGHRPARHPGNPHDQLHRARGDIRRHQQRHHGRTDGVVGPRGCWLVTCPKGFGSTTVAPGPTESAFTRPDRSADVIWEPVEAPMIPTPVASSHSS